MHRLDWIQGLIVSAAVVAAAFGSATGGALSDAFGRKKALLLGDVLFASGAIFMAAAPSISILIVGALPIYAFHARGHRKMALLAGDVQETHAGRVFGGPGSWAGIHNSAGTHCCVSTLCAW
jgi:MFS family permease